MKKEFVPYEQAVALKELGFDEICIATYDEDEYFEFLDFEQSYYTIPSKLIQAPLYQQAFRWFRKKYKLHILINVKDGIWYFERFSINGFNTYEEAELECLIKLIGTVKVNNAS
jgi:hypothetical protein